MKGVSLFNIEQGLADLIAYRAERLLDVANPPDQEERDAIEAEIRKYEIAEPVKVSGVVAIFRQWAAQIYNAETEIKRLREIVRGLKAMDARLKEHAAAALELLPEPAKGKSRSLTGADGSKLMLKGNGGVQPLHVDGWDSEREEWRENQLSPLASTYRLATVTMPWNVFLRMAERDQVLLVSIKPNNEMIRKALAEQCDQCYGTGSIPKIPVENGDCPACNGTGKKLVPGARLLERGSHVEIR